MQSNVDPRFKSITDISVNTQATSYSFISVHKHNNSVQLKRNKRRTFIFAEVVNLRQNSSHLPGIDVFT